MNFKKIKSLDYLIIHCSATKPTQEVGAKEISEWHRQRGFLAIGYHYVIRRDGSLEFGRPPMTVGAHAKGYNDVSMGICLSGGVDSQGNHENNFSKSQFRTLETLVKTIPELLGVEGVQVVGHRDLPDVSKDCPCFDVKKWFSSL